jgi:hypothetical protein
MIVSSGLCDEDKFVCDRSLLSLLKARRRVSVKLASEGTLSPPRTVSYDTFYKIFRKRVSHHQPRNPLSHQETRFLRFLIINSETRFLRFLIINSESGFLIINPETRFLIKKPAFFKKAGFS